MTAGSAGSYLDASAIVKLVIAEAESAALQHYLEDAGPLYTSRVATVEVRRAVARQAERGAREQAEAVLAALRIVELDEEMSRAAGDAAPSGMRTPDAIHVASALALGDGIRGLVAYDVRLSAAARDAGLEVVAPT